jgi:ribosomal protein S18 acetylase RimI-like enzyme
LEPGWTGLGIGSHLVNLAKWRCPRRLDLWVFQSNTRARKFYEMHGFSLEETTEGDNEEGAPDAHYAWVPAPHMLRPCDPPDMRGLRT